MYAVTLPCLFFFPVKLKLAQHFLRAVLTELSVLVWQHCSALVSAEFDSGVQFACSPCACGLLSSTPTPFRRLNICSWHRVQHQLHPEFWTYARACMPVYWWGCLNSWRPEESKNHTVGECSKVIKHKFMSPSCLPITVLLHYLYVYSNQTVAVAATSSYRCCHLWWCIIWNINLSLWTAFYFLHLLWWIWTIIESHDEYKGCNASISASTSFV